MSTTVPGAGKAFRDSETREEEIVVYLQSERCGPIWRRFFLRRTPPLVSAVQLFVSGECSKQIVGAGSDGLIISDDTSMLAVGVRMRLRVPGHYRVSYLRVSPRRVRARLASIEYYRHEAGGHTTDLPAVNLGLQGGERGLACHDSLQILIERLDHELGVLDVYRSLPLQVLRPRELHPLPDGYHFTGQRACDLVGCLLIVVATAIFFGWLIGPYIAYLRIRHGHVLYRDDTRWVRRNGRLQLGSIYKIETMFTDSDGGRRLIGAKYDVRADKWVEPASSTLVPRLLRWFGLDELPQLWNVWKGEWSLWGPRASKNCTYSLPDGTRVFEADSELRYGSSYPGLFSSLVTVCGRGYAPPNAATRHVYDVFDRYKCSLGHSIRLIAQTLSYCLFGG